MSTFSGFLDEINNVSVDRFTEVNFRSRAFFLSHCHMDHMIGMNEVNSLNQLPGPLYLSEISKVIIQRRYPAIKNMITLKTGEVTPIKFGNSEYGEIDKKTDKTSVMAIPAGHCPGSVMLLFEQNDKTVLYTGDFRLCRDNIEDMIAFKRFHEGSNLDCLYVDSTFLSLDYKCFPTQRESLNIIIKLTEKWLDAHPKNVVFLRPPANYGYEFVLMEMSQYFKFKIHVSKSTYKDYIFIPECDSYITNNIYHCGRIHLCSSFDNQWQSKMSTCLPNLDERHICIIRPTAMKWKNFNKYDKHYEEYPDLNNVYSVCYSNHSSYDEIKCLIQYLRPMTVKLNVVPSIIKQRNEIYRILDDITKEYQTKPKNVEIEQTTDVEFNFMNILTSNIKQSMSMSVAKDEISKLKIKRRRKV